MPWIICIIFKQPNHHISAKHAHISHLSTPYLISFPIFIQIILSSVMLTCVGLSSKKWEMME